jgi:hypothetical protein
MSCRRKEIRKPREEELLNCKPYFICNVCF